MGGSGGRYRLTESEMEQLRADARERLRRSRIDADVNSYLQQQLAQLNDRDTETVSERLDEIENALHEQTEEFDRVLFGGSVAKHTYVDGLSDIDSLVVLDADVVGDRTPQEMREMFREILDQRLNMRDVDEIRVGEMAVTVTYRDGMEIQLLPSIQRGDTQMIPSGSGEWSPINPSEFTSRLTHVNQRQGGAVVPAIKLAKAVIANVVPVAERPSGYHVEALAVAAFENYFGPRTPKAMVEQFFTSARKSILTPIRDVTGQSSYLDSSFGPQDSPARRALATRFERIGTRMRDATAIADWQSFLGLEP